MLVLVTYDVSTSTATGRARLRKVAKQCTNYGHRVQNSVFECIVDEGEFRALKHKLESIIDPSADSLRYYRLGNHHQTKVESVGRNTALDVDGILLF